MTGTVHPALLAYLTSVAWLACEGYGTVLLFLTAFNLGCWLAEIIFRRRKRID